MKGHWLYQGFNQCFISPWNDIRQGLVLAQVEGEYLIMCTVICTTLYPLYTIYTICLYIHIYTHNLS